MNREKTFSRSAMLFFVGVIIVGCYPYSPIPATIANSPLPEEMDKSPFSGIPCAAPCWYGLEIGVSSENDVNSTLATLTFINQETIRRYRSSMPGIDGSYGAGLDVIANCRNNSNICLEMSIVSDVLTRIFVKLNYQITQDEAIGYLGEPDLVGYGNLGSEKVICEVYLVWSGSRLVLASRFEDLEQAEKYCYIVGDEGKAPSSLLILEARYLSEAELNAYLSSISSKFFEFTGTGPDK